MTEREARLKHAKERMRLAKARLDREEEIATPDELYYLLTEMNDAQLELDLLNVKES